jgi:glycosyltransferase involved in cell wall biosynthesis
LKFRLSKTKKLRILHSNFLKNSGRDYKNRNIKGTPHILAAMERLVREGHPVEYLNIENVDSKNMRFYQAQADIVVDQLIFGSWGSTCVECLALGKPVVCYLRPSVKDFFLKSFPEYDSLPIVEADTSSIYEVLRNLVIDSKFRQQKEIESRKFAEFHFNPKRNTSSLAKLLNEV